MELLYFIHRKSRGTMLSIKSFGMMIYFIIRMKKKKKKDKQIPYSCVADVFRKIYPCVQNVLSLLILYLGDAKLPIVEL